MTNLIYTGQSVVRREGNFVSDMKGEKVMFSIYSGKYFNLGHVGGRIWELIESPVPIGKLVDSLTEEFEVDRTSCEMQVGEFLRSLLKESLIEVRSA
ncbi:lasso peptide biosynthesis PqqD family chaperone [Cohnella sp. AR92]|uniref:lasso peptide biosynthesis PqqD family chaperone n=1 Tax=Cohnella sp. AR92 TaxID=648716 RepID=UPI000F8DD1FD|nr:lasso peptide biosynthesis PqqD family chaperone [Cohnella sp. AR92]RUS42654.1 lasso peptide biosynthesis PqqD family chaperone [Cohnella sp. AR92]